MRTLLLHAAGIKLRAVCASSTVRPASFPTAPVLQWYRQRRNKSCRAAAESTGAYQYEPLVKICGIVCPEDAELVAAAGANFIGVIQCPRFRRCADAKATKEIAAIAHRAGIPVVGVFVDEDAEAICQTALQCDLDFVQLHGDPARQALDGISKQLQVVYVAQAATDGTLQTPLPSQSESSRQIDWLLVDGTNPGSGEAYDWAAVKVPADSSRKGWLLAGGLNHMNVQQTLAAVRPNAVDVSSGVAGSDGLRKDAAKIEAFMQAVASSRTPVK